MKLLLHACCAPCSVYCIDSLRKEGIEPTIYWYNPNIHPYTEYKARRDCLIDYCKKINVECIVEDEYGLEEFCKATINDVENRCLQYCYPVRMKKVVEYAKENGYDTFSSTLFYSIYQKHNELKKICENLSEKENINFLYRDFRVGFWEGHEKAVNEELYLQKYCGCIFSSDDRYYRKKKDNLELPEGFEWKR